MSNTHFFVSLFLCLILGTECSKKSFLRPFEMQAILATSEVWFDSGWNREK